MAPPGQAKEERKNAKRPKKEVESSVGIKNEASDDDVTPPPKAKKSSTARRNRTTKNNKTDEAESDAVADAPEPAITTPVKKRGPRKTAAARKAEAETANANDEMESVDQAAASPADDSNPVTAERDSTHQNAKSVTKTKKDGNKGARKNEAKEKPGLKVV